jgi:hypothetical protein
MGLNYINCVNGDTYIFPYMEHNAKTESESHFSFVFAHSLNLNYTPTTINQLSIVVSLLLCSPPEEASIGKREQQRIQFVFVEQSK